MKSDLFFMNHVPRIISGKSVLLFAFGKLRFHPFEFFYNFSHNSHQIDKIARFACVIIPFMKKYISCAIAVLLWLFALLSPVQQTAVFAASNIPSVPELSVGGYACILSNSAYFYTEPDEKSGLFLLPETYFVKIVELGEPYTKIEYLYDDTKVKKLTGYAKSEQLTAVDFVPKRPYYYCLFNVHYRLDGSIAGDTFLDEITVTCTYYGDYTVGSKTYCYVLQGEEFGYVPKPADLTIEKSTEYADNYTPPSTTPTPDENSNQAQPAQIAILIALCLLVPILAALILKPPRRPPYEPEL